MSESQVMLLIIVDIFVFLAVAGYLLETDEEEAPTTVPEADHDDH